MAQSFTLYTSVVCSPSLDLSFIVKVVILMPNSESGTEDQIQCLSKWPARDKALNNCWLSCNSHWSRLGDYFDVAVLYKGLEISRVKYVSVGFY